MPEHFSNEISQAVLQTLLYSDVFDFPLTAREVHRFLHGKLATYDQVYQTLSEDPRLIKKENYFTLIGREVLVDIRKQRDSRSRKLMPYALRYGRVLGRLPFVRMVALTGSLAVLNVSTIADFDYLLVTHPGRLWIARAFALLFGRLTRRFGHTICPNLIISENCLEWNPHDLYSARELCQMIPITGKNVYRKLMKTNQWVEEFLPNAIAESASLPPNEQERTSASQKTLELLLRGSLGDRFEQWEMDRKIARFSKQEGFGEETVFTADLCQGNFDHHRSWTEKIFQERLQKYKIEHVLTDERVPVEHWRLLRHPSGSSQ